MHAPPNFRIYDQAACLEHMGCIGFGTLIIAAEALPVIAHMPFTISPIGDEVYVRFHLARANPAVAALIGIEARSEPAMLVVNGPSHYISPDWYGSPDRVPTWNYTAIHASGPVEALDEDALQPALSELSARFEADLAPKTPWTLDKMTSGRLDAMCRAIKGFQMRIETLEGTQKMSQDKPDEDAKSVAKALKSLGTEDARRIADLIIASRGPETR